MTEQTPKRNLPATAPPSDKLPDEPSKLDQAYKTAHNISKPSDQQSKADLIAERQANLPLPDQPPVASDFNSADGSKVNVGSGAVSSDFSTGSASDTGLRGPSTTDTVDMSVGRTGKDGLSGVPSDAVTRDKKNAAGTVRTEDGKGERVREYEEGNTV